LAIADEIARVHHSQLQVLDAHEGTVCACFWLLVEAGGRAFCPVPPARLLYLPERPPPGLVHHTRAPDPILVVVHLVVPQDRSVVADVALGCYAGRQGRAGVQAFLPQVDVKFLQFAARKTVVVAGRAGYWLRCSVVQSHRQTNTHLAATGGNRYAMVVV
jgi:hypothetical protein